MPAIVGRRARWSQAAARALAAAAKDLNIEITDFLAQSIPIDPQKVGGPDLIAAGCSQRRRQQRVFDLAQNAMIETSGRQPVFKFRKIGSQVTLDRGAETF